MKSNYGVRDARLDTSESMFVMNNATKISKVPSEIILTHTPRDGDPVPIKIERSTNPIDLSLFAPKEELLRNSQLLNLINKGMLTLISEDQAMDILDSPMGKIETERLQAKYANELSRLGKPLQDIDGEVVTTISQDFREEIAKGEVDAKLVGVTPSIAQVMTDRSIDDSTRAAMLNSFVADGLVTAKDKAYIRSTTNNEMIRKMIG